MSAPGAAPINAEEADNFEEIEKQFAVKGKYTIHNPQPKDPIAPSGS